MEAVLATGYDGLLLAGNLQRPVSRRLAARGVAVDGQRSLIYLMDQLRGHIGTGALGQARAAMPPRAQCLGIEFIEFAADDRSAAELAQLFAGLGFRKAGEHKSKAVTRWSQGAINLVHQQRQGRLRAFPQHHARAFGLRHGLKVDERDGHARPRREAPRHAVPPGGRTGRAGNSGGARARRQPALFRRSEQRARPALGHRLRARRASRQDNGSAGLTAVDHISQSMHYEEMLSWLLFYTSLLDVRPKRRSSTSSIRAASCAARWCRPLMGALRIALNASQSQQTLSSRFLTRLFRLGRAAHRLCNRRYRCDRQAAAANGVDDADDSGKLLRRSRGAHPTCRRTARRPCAPTTSSTTATTPANICRPTRRASRICSFSRSSSGAATKALALSMLRSASMPSRGWRVASRNPAFDRDATVAHSSCGSRCHRAAAHRSCLTKPRLPAGRACRPIASGPHGFSFALVKKRLVRAHH